MLLFVESYWLIWILLKWFIESLKAFVSNPDWVITPKPLYNKFLSTFNVIFFIKFIPVPVCEIIDDSLSNILSELIFKTAFFVVAMFVYVVPVQIENKYLPINFTLYNVNYPFQLNKNNFRHNLLMNFHTMLFDALFHFIYYLIELY